ncbi:putative lipid-transfer protein DIR1 [Cardamine amara subsp. amara]|uniref:Lipid-transfer protein DIR1 n=1 Tax=Cardamine amara subsp. amara TaxID=228776 RepID=A0ABD1ASC1_CARAN
MDKNNTITLVKYAAFAMVLAALALMEQPTSVPVCNINANWLEKCRPAVTGNNPPPPRDECCLVLWTANLECICRSKSYLPVLGSNPSKVHALLSKCNITTIPPACQGKNQKY